jgi:hypothetical protein
MLSHSNLSICQHLTALRELLLKRLSLPRHDHHRHDHHCMVITRMIMHVHHRMQRLTTCGSGCGLARAFRERENLQAGLLKITWNNIAMRIPQHCSYLK